MAGAEWITGGGWRQDTVFHSGMPRNFRLCTDAFPETEEELPSREGLDTLMVSASAQPSGGELVPLFNKLQEMSAGAAVYIVDLRGESHGFVNNRAVSWFIEHNRANIGKSQAQILAEEKATLSVLPETTITALPYGKTDTKLFAAYTGRVISVSTEQEAAEKAGFSYRRFTVMDDEWPQADRVDAFLDFVRSLKGQRAWLHFHCHAGHGRTTTFLMIYDILRNPKVALEDIALRHRLQGGSDILTGSEKATVKAGLINNRAAKMRLFYEFAGETDPLVSGASWSEWLTAWGE